MDRRFVSALCLLIAPSASACRYNIREIGFVDVAQPVFRLAVFVHGDEQKDWLPGFQAAAQRTLGPSNVSWEVIDEAHASAPELRHRQLLGPRLPGGVVIAAGGDNGWPVYLRLPPNELETKLAALVQSPVRAQIVNAVIDTYGAVLLLRSADESANHAARLAAREAIGTIESSLADLPKRIERGPQFIECDPSLPDEQILAWSLGENGKDLAAPVAAVLFGRGRLAGPALKAGSLTSSKIRDQLSVIGADCECTLDHAWMSAGALPLAISPDEEARTTAALGFDPHAASVKAEVHQILQVQSAIAADPAARPGAGYRETPLEIIPIAAGLPTLEKSVPGGLPPGKRSSGLWWIVAGTALAFLVWAGIHLRRRRTGGGLAP